LKYTELAGSLNRTPRFGQGLILLSLLSSFGLLAQQTPTPSNYGSVHGNFQFDGYLYFKDTELDPDGSDYPDEQFLGQGFANLIYQRSNNWGELSAGLRYENYQNPILGYPPGFVGEGITYRFLQWKRDRLDITVGNFYEQFGSGLIHRSYEERLLGLDNAMDGIRLKYTPIDGLYLKGILGKQRVYFTKGPGIVRGIDAEANFNELFDSWADKRNKLAVGVSFTSKFQAANDPFFNLPENVGAAAARATYGIGGFSLNTEWAYKINDPSADNGYIYKPGGGSVTTVNYTTKGFGFSGAYKFIDNMAFRSDRNAGQFELFMNYLPPTTKFHTYALPSLYPYATQINGETGLQLEFSFQLPKETWLGGTRGGSLNLNYSDAHSIVKKQIDAETSIGEAGTDGYETEWFKQGDIRYFQDINVAYSRSLSKAFKATLTYYNIEYNQGTLGSATNSGGLNDTVILNDPSRADMAYINAVVFEGLWKIKPKHSLRFELQGLFTEQDRGDIAMLLLEYSVAPNWFFAVQDIWNYGNADESRRLHYPLLSAGYNTGTTRFQLNMGRQQQGIFCVGGICRVVPASTSMGLTITSNF